MMGLYIGCLYLLQVFFLIGFYCYLHAFFYVSLAFGLLSFPLFAANIVIACLKIGLPDMDAPKFSLVAKLILIPFFAANLFVCLCALSGFLNPWLFWAAPAIILLEVGLTYVVLLASSANLIAYLLRKTLQGEIPLKWGVIHIILQFCFVLDVVDAIAFYFSHKKKAVHVETAD